MPGKSNLEKEQEARTNRKMSIKVLDSIIKKKKRGGKEKVGLSCLRMQNGRFTGPW